MEPMPYVFYDDDILTLLMLLGFIVISIAVGFLQRFIIQQVKTFFRSSRNKDGRALLSSTDLRLQLLLVGQTALQFALLLYVYCSEWISGETVVSRHLYILYFFLFIAGYFLFKSLLYSFVNGVFIDGRSKRQWMYSLLFITAMEGVLLFPVSVAAIYIGISITVVFWWTLIVVGLVKILTFCKCFNIFFRPLGGYLQFFLYLCTLEIVPLLMMWAGLGSMENILK